MKITNRSIIGVLLFALPALLPAAGSDKSGPAMVIAAAEEAAHADTLIGECRFDDAEHWLQEAVRTAKDARSDDKLVRDVAGSAVGQMTIKLDEFKRQRKAWDHALTDARKLLEASHLDAAHARLDQAAAPKCEQRFNVLRNEIVRRAEEAADLVRQGDAQAARFPKTAHDFYLQAQEIDPDQPGLRTRLMNVERRIPELCAGCEVKAGNSYVQRQQADGSSH